MHSICLTTTNVDVGRWLQPKLIVILDVAAPPRIAFNPSSDPEKPRIRITYDPDAYDDCQPAQDEVATLMARLTSEQVRLRSRLVAAERSRGDTSKASGVSRQATSSVKLDRLAVEACSVFGFSAADVNTTRHVTNTFVTPDELLKNRTNWRVAAIVGPSGSGKSLTLLDIRRFDGGVGASCPSAASCFHAAPGESVAAIISHHSGGRVATPADAADAMCVHLGLPVAVASRTFSTLSDGERHMATVTLAMVIAAANGQRVVTIDEFTSNLDRITAKRVCSGVRGLMDRLTGHGKLTLLVATVHIDIIELLQAEVAFNSSSRVCHLLEWSSASASGSGGAAAAASSTSSSTELSPSASLFARPTIAFTLCTAHDYPKAGGEAQRLWESTFEEHHYKEKGLNKGASTRWTESNSHHVSPPQPCPLLSSALCSAHVRHICESCPSRRRSSAGRVWGACGHGCYNRQRLWL